MTHHQEPVWRQAIAGAQILFVAFGALVLVPILTGLNPSMALLGAGIGTLIFQACTGRKVPIFLGSSFAFIAPIIYSVQTWGIPATLSGLFASGALYLMLALLIKMRGVAFIHRIMPPVVVGPIIMLIGLGLAGVAVNLAMGKTGDGKAVLVDYQTALLVAGVSLATTVVIALKAKGIFRLIPILAGVTVGYSLSAFLGLVNFSTIAAAPWFAMPPFVAPQWSWPAVFFMIPVALAPAIEHVGDIIAIGAVTGRDYTARPGLHRTMLGDGLAVCVAGLIGGPPVTTYSEVTGAVMITRNHNPVIMTWAACIAILMAFFGKFNALLQSIPTPVMGGIMILLFGSIAAVGLNTLIHARVDMHRPRNLVIVSLVLVFGIGGLTLQAGWVTLQGVSLCGITAVLLNLFLPKEKRDSAQQAF
ncbi:uracil-xanthine permease [Geobacter sulfurreducens]|uniref:Uracil transporter n=1 Tax=Geobacter sulfurreducens (strain ATCC 51573 / DSM 12127 / PCA) TaxID=243231 RepID=Q74EN0_GEOSL|nr:uracil-xanthine permease family protein [Geobacter sulfurreducens]AAR34259.1 uracil transporter [Geobacter sulfurreducens PCA]ADI83780.1 uracil transporter [Geobacter sulfurreducens KN400]AJY70671.1 uracil transporter [Geobacter sulfurreducens]QVW36176.1 uracil-xanthine permease [Geobacter sulfurreducens]UAC04989.1 uracil-xanthine permease family protein [Geobacter sulfurreducens]